LKQAGSPVWVFMIHSSEIVPCHVLCDETAVRAFRERCTAAVRVAIELGAQPATLSEAAEWVKATHVTREALRLSASSRATVEAATRMAAAAPAAM
jgi:hypothetical protein